MSQDKQTATREQMEAEITQLREKLVAAESAKRGGGTVTFKVSAKGGVSAYGLGRFPVTLYRSQWEKLTADPTIAQLREFISRNSERLTSKDDAKEEAKAAA